MPLPGMPMPLSKVKSVDADNLRQAHVLPRKTNLPVPGLTVAESRPKHLPRRKRGTATSARASTLCDRHRKSVHRVFPEQTMFRWKQKGSPRLARSSTGASRPNRRKRIRAPAIRLPSIRKPQRDVAATLPKSSKSGPPSYGGPFCWYDLGVRYLIGIDEAGRGPLAGPVSVGAVLVPADFDWTLVRGVKDSKQLRAQQREDFFARMKELEHTGSMRFAVSFSSVQIIEERGIVFAVQSALNRAIRRLVENPVGNANDRPEYEVRLDGGLHAPREFSMQKTIIRGDVTEPVISLASIAAKVLRDRHMEELAQKYPAYGFDAHKGYGTLEHRRAIARVGLSDIHRATFCTRLRVGPKSV